MNRIISAALIAAATTVVSWAVGRWLVERRSATHRGKGPSLETWENEGGALAPHHAAVETSQVPR